MDGIWHSTKAAACVAIAAIGSGLSSILQISNQELGVLSTLAGIILSLTMAWSNWRRTRNETRKTELDIQIAQEQRERDRRAYQVRQDLDTAQGDTE